MAPFCRQWILVIVLALAVVFAGCGDDDEDAGAGEKSAPTPAAGDAQTYCKLVADLDREGTKFFKQLEQRSDATARDFAKAEAAFVKSHQEDLDALQQAAPAAIATDTETLIASQRDRAGLGPRVDQAKANAAEKRVQKFEKRSCG